MLAMLVDDSRSSLLHLQRLLEDSGEVESRAFDDPDLALHAAGQARFDLVIVDHVMPKMDGIAFMRRLRGMPAYAQVPVVMLTGTCSRAVRLAALDAGATDLLPKRSSSQETAAKLRNLVVLSRALGERRDPDRNLLDRVEAATLALATSHEEMIFRLSLAIEYRDNDTGGHTLRVARYSRMIAEEMRLPAELCRAIYRAAPLHDIGKVAIPDEVLLKPGRLTADETAVMRSHAAIGERILSDSPCDLIRLAGEIAGHHHERWDGGGYPRGLSGPAIPLSARIVAVADAFDAMTTDRPYKVGRSPEGALAELAAERGRHFDPACVDAFLAAHARQGAPVAAMLPPGRQAGTGSRRAVHAGPPPDGGVGPAPRGSRPAPFHPRKRENLDRHEHHIKDGRSDGRCPARPG